MKDFGKLLDDIMKENEWETTSGLLVRAHRKRFNMTLKDLEEVTGIRESNLSAIENSRIEMTPHYADILAAAFGVTPASLLYPAGTPRTKELAEVAKRMAKFMRRVKPKKSRVG